jgi:hypothetical protein
MKCISSPGKARLTRRLRRSFQSTLLRSQVFIEQPKQGTVALRREVFSGNADIKVTTPATVNSSFVRVQPHGALRPRSSAFTLKCCGLNPRTGPTTCEPRHRRDAQGCQRFENRIKSQYEEHCLGTPDSGRSYARRAHASGSCPRSWMSPSVGSVLGEQGQQPADQCRLYARPHRAGAQSAWGDCVFGTDTRSAIALIEMFTICR